MRRCLLTVLLLLGMCSLVQADYLLIAVALNSGPKQPPPPKGGVGGLPPVGIKPTPKRKGGTGGLLPGGLQPKRKGKGGGLKPPPIVAPPIVVPPVGAPPVAAPPVA